MAKLKLSVTLPPDLVARIDHAAEQVPGGNRSAVIERWLWTAADLEARRALDQATVEYYAARSATSRAEDEEWGRFSAAQPPRLDAAPPRTKPRRPARKARR